MITERAKESPFALRHAIERLRMGIFDPVAVRVLTVEAERIQQALTKGLDALAKKSCSLSVVGSYGQGKSHTLAYFKEQALAKSYAVSIINVDPRELPLCNMPAVYHAVMKTLTLPDGYTFITKWQQWGQDQLKTNKLLTPDDLIPKQMPHRFRMILIAHLNKTLALSAEERGLKKHRGYRPKEFNYWLSEALFGINIPVTHLKNTLKYRAVDHYNDHPLTCRGNEPYLQMIQALGSLLQTMGYGGWVILFDEGESIAQLSRLQRSQSYRILDAFFHNPHPGLFSIFAFTEDFFDQVNRELYEKTKVSRGNEVLIFPEHYAIKWKPLARLTLQDLTSSEWEILQHRLIQLYEDAYHMTCDVPHIKPKMAQLLKQLHNQETRFKLKALIHLLDVESYHET